MIGKPSKISVRLQNLEILERDSILEQVALRACPTTCNHVLVVSLLRDRSDQVLRTETVLISLRSNVHDMTRWSNATSGAVLFSKGGNSKDLNVNIQRKGFERPVVRKLLFFNIYFYVYI